MTEQGPQPTPPGSYGPGYCPACEETVEFDGSACSECGWTFQASKGSSADDASAWRSSWRLPNGSPSYR